VAAPVKTSDVARLNGTQKVAILLMTLGKDRASRLLQTMRESEVAEVAAEIARLPSVPQDVVHAVLEEFKEMAQARVNIATGGLEYARTMLVDSLGPKKAQEIMELLATQMIEAPFEFLRDTDPRQVLSFVSEEHPQTIALVLAHMLPDAAAMVLGSLPEALQRDVAVRIAMMDRTSPDVIERVEQVLQRKLSSVLQQSDFSEAGGVDTLVDILNRADRGTERLILEGLELANEELADEVRQLMFVFEDIVNLDDRSVQLILRQVDTKDLAIALKGVQSTVKDKIKRNMSERAGQNLMEEIDLMGPVRLKDVESAQGGIVRVIRSLEEAGQIVLSRSGDEFVS
jgi:flagellar motor switch protein FliG